MQKPPSMSYGIMPENIMRHELIGLECTVSKCSDVKKTGISGKIIDETQKTLRIETGKKEFIVAKKDCMFDIHLPQGDVVEVDGKILYGRPEERIKKKFAKTWRELK